MHVLTNARLVARRLGDDLRVGEKGTRHRNKIHASGCEDGLGAGERVDAIAGDDRQLPTAAFTAAANGTQTPLGTTCCTVGIDDSCQPMPTLSASTPSAASARANARVSAGVVEAIISRRRRSGRSLETRRRQVRESRATPREGDAYAVRDRRPRHRHAGSSAAKETG